MNTVKHCMRCGQWFAPLHVDDLLCHNCKAGSAEKMVKWWWIAFAGAMIGIVIILLL